MTATPQVAKGEGDYGAARQALMDGIKDNPSFKLGDTGFSLGEKIDYADFQVIDAEGYIFEVHVHEPTSKRKTAE